MKSPLKLHVCAHVRLLYRLDSFSACHKKRNRGLSMSLVLTHSEDGAGRVLSRRQDSGREISMENWAKMREQVPIFILVISRYLTNN